MAGTQITNGESYKVSEYWNRVATDFDAIYSGRKSLPYRLLDRWLRRDMYQRFDWVMSRAGNVRGASICDVGCGSGRFATALARQGGRVTGLDFAPRMLELARELAESEGVTPRCRFVLTDVLDWAAPEQFDLVIAIGFWDYVADPLTRLRVIRRMTSGRFFSAWPRSGTVRAAIRGLRLKVSGCPVYFWRREQIERCLKQAGFQPYSWQVYGQLHCVESRPCV
jgi:2-polyprenyl-3-methyl-5-hydroxy-6-metoxy-1,4-benzoquinol methylase